MIWLTDAKALRDRAASSAIRVAINGLSISSNFSAH